MNTPKESNIVCVAAPAGMLEPADIAPMTKYLEEKGYQVELGPNVFKKYFYGYNYAGTPAERISDMQWALDHPTAKAIWCARGGYGGVQLIDHLDWSGFQKNFKWLVGYSDNTVFHQYLSRIQIPSIHGMTLKLLSKEQSAASWDSVFEIMEQLEMKNQFDSHDLNLQGEISAPITGGNLSILYSLLGSSSIDTFKDKIVFMEDWQENWYHLDRMLTAMHRAGIFEGIKGLLVGSFTKMDDRDENLDYSNAYDAYAYQIISDHFKSMNIPKAFGLPMGHIDDNRALLLGHEVKLNVGNSEVTLSASVKR